MFLSSSGQDAALSMQKRGFDSRKEQKYLFVLKFFFFRYILNVPFV